MHRLIMSMAIGVPVVARLRADRWEQSNWSFVMLEDRSRGTEGPKFETKMAEEKPWIEIGAAVFSADDGGGRKSGNFDLRPAPGMKRMKVEVLTTSAAQVVFDITEDVQYGSDRRVYTNLRDGVIVVALNKRGVYVSNVGSGGGGTAVVRFLGQF